MQEKWTACKGADAEIGKGLYSLQIYDLSMNIGCNVPEYIRQYSKQTDFAVQPYGIMLPIFCVIAIFCCNEPPWLWRLLSPLQWKAHDPCFRILDQQGTWVDEYYCTVCKLHISLHGIQTLNMIYAWGEYYQYWPCNIYRSKYFCMMTSSNRNIFRVTGHLCGEFTAPRWIHRAKASDAELWCFLWSAPE